VLARVVTHRQPVMSAPFGFLAQPFDRESTITFALVLSADVKPPQITVEQRVLVLGGKRGHEEAHQLAAVVDQPGPCDIGHRLGLGQGPGDRGNKPFLIKAQRQLAASSHVVLGYRFQSHAHRHVSTVGTARALADSLTRLAETRRTNTMSAGGCRPVRQPWSDLDGRSIVTDRMAADSSGDSNATTHRAVEAHVNTWNRGVLGYRPVPRPELIKKGSTDLMPPAEALWLRDEGGLTIPPTVDPEQAQQTRPSRSRSFVQRGAAP
jgi:hypothetical protein